MTSGPPRVFISYSHDSDEHDARVLAFANRLGGDGIDCILDQYDPHPSEPWPAWMDRHLDDARFVLVVCTESYYSKSKSGKDLVSGRGVKFESVLIVGDLYEAGMSNERFIPVLFEELPATSILRPLRGYTRYRVDQERGYADLLDHVTGKTRFLKPVPGTSPHPRPAQTAGPPLEDLARYLERLRSAHRYLPIAGFATRVRLPIRLESVYVPLRARVFHHVLESEHLETGSFRELAGEGEDREVAFDEALPLATRHGFRGAVVLGDPGTGKTTLLKHFLLCEPGRLGLPPETVPVFVELRRLKAPAAGLRAVLDREIPGNQRAIQTLPRGSCGRHPTGVPGRQAVQPAQSAGRRRELE